MAEWFRPMYHRLSRVDTLRTKSTNAQHEMDRVGSRVRNPMGTWYSWYDAHLRLGERALDTRLRSADEFRAAVRHQVSRDVIKRRLVGSFLGSWIVLWRFLPGPILCWELVLFVRRVSARDNLWYIGLNHSATHNLLLKRHLPTDLLTMIIQEAVSLML